MTRGVHEQIFRELRPQCCQELLPQQGVAVAAVVEFLSQLRSHGKRVFHGPGRGRVVHEPEFQRQVRAAPLHAGIHAANVSLTIVAVPR